MHVLSLPPAFALSQDQTLKLEVIQSARSSRIDGAHNIATAFPPHDCELPKRKTAEVSSTQPNPKVRPDPQGLRRPRFSFHIHLSKSSISTMRTSFADDLAPGDPVCYGRLCLEASAPRRFRGSASVNLVRSARFRCQHRENDSLCQPHPKMGRSRSRQIHRPDRSRVDEPVDPRKRLAAGRVRSPSMDVYLDPRSGAVNTVDEVFATAAPPAGGRGVGELLRPQGERPDLGLGGLGIV